MEIACTSDPGVMASEDLAFAIEACNIQMEKDFAPAWALEPWPLVPYASLKGLPAGTFWALAIRSSLDVDGALGYHDFLQGVIYSECVYQGPLTGITISHEAVEMRADPNCNIWAPMGDGRFIAQETADPCEEDTYPVHVNLLGKERDVLVSDFVLPSYFEMDGEPPYTFMESIGHGVKITEPFGLSQNGGGYRIILEKDGTVIYDFGKKITADKQALIKSKISSKLQRMYSRTRRRRTAEGTDISFGNP